MSKTMRAAVADGAGGIEIQDLPVPTAQEGWVVIAPVGTGVCGTDLHLISGDYPHGRFPVVPGHEFAGYVTEVGAGVTSVQEGDYVGVNPNVSCGKCTWCLRGATNLCQNILPVGVAINGSVAEFVAVPSEIVFPLNTSISHGAAPLIEPFACVLHALERVPDWKEQELVIFGAGSIGLMAVILGRAEGATGIRVVEPNEARRNAALELGAVQAVASADDLDNKVFDLALDASGHPVAISQAISSLGPRGRLVQMGVASPTATVALNPYEVFAKELSIIGSNSLAEKYGESAERMVDLQDELKSLVTATFTLEDYAEALTAAKSPDQIKVQVTA
ncbi:2-desacetyl-2-hydroxyethyl bacteriochlorophyllide A dehydrogenase [Frigoribacterium sp. PhB160]|nr:MULTISPECIES: alcohol dehydrogenase catalytic domain-containing protein [unclassified Frigoribacterium]ROP78835.1 2-desacetyl-2-hydroxyethyl bacteriochlorophyllide A dehydrogenase [Frigoribacterium sp. PhB107]ROS48903.1 2-desacetyl-2-hydroxyethyl bacteriochlorophyllide A dehydrogenase [Frigoribacterium sp. PhB24]ROS61130.1 2-desacetyl-2-hydroxyethyl bacteriochlorophyllide A dehydrogenase [Frigoribacterium sp. PhB160]